MNAHFEKRIVEAKTSRQRRYYIRCADGLCVKCGKPNNRVTTFCDGCRARHAAESFKSYRTRKGIKLDIPKHSGRPISQ